MAMNGNYQAPYASHLDSKHLADKKASKPDGYERIAEVVFKSNL